MGWLWATGDVVRVNTCKLRVAILLYSELTLWEVAAPQRGVQGPTPSYFVPTADRSTSHESTSRVTHGVTPWSRPPTPTLQALSLVASVQVQQLAPHTTARDGRTRLSLWTHAVQYMASTELELSRTANPPLATETFVPQASSLQLSPRCQETAASSRYRFTIAGPRE